MLNQFGVSEIPGALMGGWATPTDDQMPEGVGELAKVIGDPLAARASWQRRLVVMGDGTWRLLISECGFMSSGSLVQFCPGSVTPVPVAVPIDVAVPLLRLPENCETELARRQRFLADLNERHALQELAERNAREARAKQSQDAVEAAKVFRWDDWRALTDWQRLAYSIALSVDNGEDLAPALRRIAGSVQSFHGERAVPLAPPRAQWW
jgi:hypothetical protein